LKQHKKNNEIGYTCSSHRIKKCVRGMKYCLEVVKGEDQFEEVSVVAKIILKLNLRRDGLQKRKLD